MNPIVLTMGECQINNIQEGRITVLKRKLKPSLEMYKGQNFYSVDSAKVQI